MTNKEWARREIEREIAQAGKLLTEQLHDRAWQLKRKKYKNYGKGRELRILVDELSAAQEKLMRARCLVTDAEIEIQRITDIVAALAAQLRAKK